jgi:hypothetical protein
MKKFEFVFRLYLFIYLFIYLWVSEWVSEWFLFNAELLKLFVSYIMARTSCISTMTIADVC